MRVARLEAWSARCFEHLSIELDPELSIFFGGNGSGKTTVLETLYLLGTGKSFRAPRARQCLRSESERLVVAAQMAEGGLRLAMEVSERGVKGRIGESESAGVAEVAAKLPVIALTPETHLGFLGQGKARRGAIDWVLFHVEPQFGPLWAKYQRALKQRNQALQNREPARALLPWDEIMVETCEPITAARLRLWAEFAVEFVQAAEQLLPEVDAEIVFQPGWDVAEGEDFRAVLAARLEQDRARSTTSSGPHRADIEILASGAPFKERASQGQQKLLVMAIRLAQLRCLRRLAEKSAIVLVDDLPSELDEAHRTLLLGALGSLESQVLVSATDHHLVPVAAFKGHSLFHVEHGAVTKI